MRNDEHSKCLLIVIPTLVIRDACMQEPSIRALSHGSPLPIHRTRRRTSQTPSTGRHCDAWQHGRIAETRMDVHSARAGTDSCDVEVVVSDCGSTDGTAQIARRQGAQASPFFLPRHPTLNLGPSGGRDRGQRARDPAQRGMEAPLQCQLLQQRMSEARNVLAAVDFFSRAEKETWRRRIIHNCSLRGVFLLLLLPISVLVSFSSRGQQVRAPRYIFMRREMMMAASIPTERGSQNIPAPRLPENYAKLMDEATSGSGRVWGCFKTIETEVLSDVGGTGGFHVVISCALYVMVNVIRCNLHAVR